MGRCESTCSTYSAYNSLLFGGVIKLLIVCFDRFGQVDLVITTYGTLESECSGLDEADVSSQSKRSSQSQGTACMGAINDR